jgi:hypothetical protein
MDSANARKLSAALGMSILFAKATGFPWSFDSASASLSRFSSMESAILLSILALSAAVVFDHLFK